MKSKNLFLKKTCSIIDQYKTILESLKMVDNTILNLDTHLYSSNVKTCTRKITVQESEQGRKTIQRIRGGDVEGPQ